MHICSFNLWSSLLNFHNINDSSNKYGNGQHKYCKFGTLFTCPLYQIDTFLVKTKSNGEELMCLFSDFKSSEHKVVHKSLNIKYIQRKGQTVHCFINKCFPLIEKYFLIVISTWWYILKIDDAKIDCKCYWNKKKTLTSCVLVVEGNTKAKR